MKFTANNQATLYRLLPTREGSRRKQLATAPGSSSKKKTERLQPVLFDVKPSRKEDKKQDRICPQDQP
jgi:hypothetical protein